jgi:hypothetical protein
VWIKQRCGGRRLRRVVFPWGGANEKASRLLSIDAVVWRSYQIYVRNVVVLIE